MSGIFCQALQGIYETLRCVPLVSNRVPAKRWKKSQGLPPVSWKESQGFKELCAHSNDLQHQVTLERAKTHSKEDGEQGFVEFGGIGIAYSTLYKLNLGG